MAKNCDKKDWGELAEKYKVTPEMCEEYNQFYDTIVLPRIEKSYLASLISVVEALIDEKIREEIKKEIRKDISEKEAGTPALRRYNIILSDKPPRKNAKSYTREFPHGAIIVYDPKDSEKDICFTIVHELGHLLLKHGILPGSQHTENLANLFVHFVSGGVIDD